MFDKDVEDELEFSKGKKTSRRVHRTRRIDVMKEFESGIVENRPIKERFSREFKKPKIKKIKDPLEKVDEAFCEKALVIEVHRRTCEVRFLDKNGDWKIVTAMYRATTSKALGEFPAVGDLVLVAQVNEEEDSGKGVGSQKYCIVRVCPRKSELKRPGPRDSFYKKQTLAANIDQVVIVASVTQPEFNYGFLDRFLLAANLNNLPFVLVLTKMDLLKNGEQDLNKDIREFQSITDKVIFISVKTGLGLSDLRKELKGKSSVFSGQSGVGKSTLINALVPGATLLTGEVRLKDGKGRHTTTSSSLLDLKEGGFVIDTPGIRSIGIFDRDDDLDNKTLAKIFPGFFKDNLFTCKFSNCLHIGEKGCSVCANVKSGVISSARYASYLRILKSKS